MKKHLLSLAAMALLATGAQATTTNWGTHDPVEVGLNFIPTLGVPTGFNDLFIFTVGAGTMLTATSAEALTTAPLTPIVGGTYSLISYGLDNTLGTGDDSVLGTWAYGAGTGSVVHSLSAGPGMYLYAVSGVSAGPVGGAYSFTSTVTPVPEPGAGLMLLAGLGVVGLLARRRS